MRPLKNYSNKNFLTSNKRGSTFQISKRHKKQRHNSSPNRFPQYKIWPSITVSALCNPKCNSPFN